MTSDLKRIQTANQKMQEVLQAELERYYYQLGVSVFEWSGLPDDQRLAIPRRQIEKLLYYNGTCTLFRNPGTGEFMVLPVAEQDIVKNVYGEPSSWRAMALGELAGPIAALRLDWSDAVLIRNNDSYSASAPYVRELVRNMVNVELTKRLNVNAQKCVFQFKSSDRTVLSDKIQFMQLYECEPVIYTDRMLVDDLEPVTWNVPPLMAELDDAYNVYDQRVCEYLGIDCVNRDKAERLTAEEADGNDQKIACIRQNRLRQREYAVERAREIWPDLDLRVSLSSEVLTKETDDPADAKDMKEDEKNDS